MTYNGFSLLNPYYYTHKKEKRFTAKTKWVTAKIKRYA